MEQRVASPEDLVPVQLKQVKVGDVLICLARAEDGEWYAISDTCSHEAYSLSEGDVWGCDVECPLHASRFNLRTGEPDQLPAVKPVATYPVTVRADGVYVEVT